MIIECPACQSRYRIREEKLPPGGGNIKCPSCAHVFFVTMPGGDADAAASGAGSPPTVPFAPDTGAPPNATLLMGAPPVRAEAPVNVEPTVTGSHAPVKQKWKVKNPVGLIYDFSDTDSLRRWLQTRDSLDGLAVSADGGTSWGALETFAELRDVKPASRKTALAMSAISGDGRPLSAGDAATAAPNPEAMREQAQARLEQARKQRGTDTAGRAPANASGQASTPAAANGNARKASSAGRPGQLMRRNGDETSGSSIGIAVVVLLLGGVALFFGLRSAGFIGASDEGTSMPSADAPPQTSPLQPGAPLDQGAAGTEVRRPQTDRERVSQALGRAAEALQTGNTQGAIGHLERAAFLDPENRELACQLAILYLRENRPEDAAAARSRCEGGDAAAEAPVEGELPPGSLPEGEMPLEPALEGGAPAEPGMEPDQAGGAPGGELNP